MKREYGYATYRRGKLYFDNYGWSLVKAVARKQHKTPTQVVNSAIKRLIRAKEKNQVE